jgi:hypothetical protein
MKRTLEPVVRTGMDEKPAVSPRVARVLIVIAVVVFVVALAAAAWWFPARAARSVSHHRCARIGGTWRSDVVGHGSYCDTSRVSPTDRTAAP